MLSNQTQAVNAQGGIAEILKKSVAGIPQATEATLTSPSISGFQAELGRAPTAAELAQYTADFDTQQVNKYGGMVAGSYMTTDPTTGVQSAPGVPTPTAGAAQFAMQNNPGEFFMNKMMNARSMLSSAITGSTPIAQTGATATEKPS